MIIQNLRLLFNMHLPYILFLFIFQSYNVSFAQGAKASPHIINPGLGVCRESWIKTVQDNYSVRFEREFIDKDGKAIPNPNSLPFCSGSLARVGPEAKLKIISAAHCASEKFKNAPHGLQKIPNPLPPEQVGKVPPNAVGIRIVARIGGRDPAIPINSFNGPTLTASPDSADVKNEYRKNDFIVMDSSETNLEDFVVGKKIPSLCDSKMTREDIDKAAVIGFGVTHTGKPSLQPLCAEQKVNTIENQIITIAPYEKGSSGGCPGDSGGGLWFKPKKSNEACLAGAVSGPRSGSVIKSEKPLTALEHCSQEGIEAIYSSVYQSDIEPYLQTKQVRSDETTSPQSNIQ